MAARPTLSLVIPIYNEEETIPELDRRLRAFLGVLNETWEVIFINDGSRDRSPALLKALAASESRYRVISFARNFGHQIAITAGMDYAEGEAVVVMDADLQDPPEVVQQMLERWREGYDVVFGVREKRHGESFLKKLTAAVFYRLLRSMIGFEIPVDAGDFRLMARPVILTMRALRERHRFIRGMVAWVGFRQTKVLYERPGRFAGETKYPLSKMLRFAMDGITSFSIIPLRMATWLGLLSGLGAVTIGLWALFERLSGRFVVTGWTTIMLFVSLGFSAQLLMTGILGEYVGRIYEEVKRRPLYTVGELLNLSPLPAPAMHTEPPSETVLAQKDDGR